jgi:hypothetical protein
MVIFRLTLTTQFALLSFLVIFLALNNEAIINSLVTKKVPKHSRSPLVSRVEIQKPKIKFGDATKLHIRDYFPSEPLNYTRANTSGILKPFNTLDYTCSPGSPCSNGACCGASGFCGYGILRLFSELRSVY